MLGDEKEKYINRLRLLILKTGLTIFLLTLAPTANVLNADLTSDFNVTFYTNRGQDSTGTTGDPNSGITDSGNSASSGSVVATLSVVDKDTFKITMGTQIDSSTLFQVTGVDWGSGGIIDTVSIGTQSNLEIPAIWLTSTSFAVRTTAELQKDNFFTIDVTGIHVPEPKTYISLGMLLGLSILIRRRRRSSQ